MRRIVFPSILIAAVVVAVFGGYYWGERTTNAEIARIALVDVDRAIRVKTAIYGNSANDINNLLDVGIYQDIYRMQALDTANANDKTYLTSRLHTIVSLKKLWIAHPPYALDELQMAYIESICKLSNECPSGEIKPQTPPMHLDRK